MAAFTNRAILSYDGKTTASNTVTGELIGALTLTKTALSDEYSAGDSITYTISLVNTGASAMDGLTVSDDLGAFEAAGGTVRPLSYVEGTAALFINGLPQAAPAVSSGDGLEFTGISVPAGGNALIIYETEVSPYAPLAAGSEIVNTVSASGGTLRSSVTALPLPWIPSQRHSGPVLLRELRPLPQQICYHLMSCRGFYQQCGQY